MHNWLEQETLLRLLPFIGIFLIMTIWEIVAPRRALSQGKGFRWMNNLGLVVLNSLLLRLIFPAAGVGVALFAETNQWGLFHWIADSASVLIILISILFLDFAIWFQHLTFHRVPLLWRLHRMHHTDLDIDVTTALRFHPVEILMSMAIKASLILLLGIPVIAVLLFEILLNATAMFNHGNVSLNSRLDKWLRLIIVTPDMHRVHHSWHPEETNSNYGFNLPWWDRLFGTYRAQPKDGHDGMTIGLREFRDPQDHGLPRLLAQPFIKS